MLLKSRILGGREFSEEIKGDVVTVSNLAHLRVI